jgi:hypothetical protein
VSLYPVSVVSPLQGIATRHFPMPLLLLICIVALPGLIECRIEPLFGGLPDRRLLQQTTATQVRVADFTNWPENPSNVVPLPEPNLPNAKVNVSASDAANAALFGAFDLGPSQIEQLNRTVFDAMVRSEADMLHRGCCWGGYWASLYAGRACLLMREGRCSWEVASCNA